MTQNVLKNKK